MNKEVVVDACLIIKRVVPESMSDKVKVLLRRWKQAEIALIAPVFFMGEVDSILRQKVVSRKELTLEQAQLCWEQLQEIPARLSQHLLRHTLLSHRLTRILPRNPLV